MNPARCLRFLAGAATELKGRAMRDQRLVGMNERQAWGKTVKIERVAAVIEWSKAF